MENSLRLPEPPVRGRAKSWHDLNVGDLDLSGILQKNRRKSFLDSGKDETSNSIDIYEGVYNIADINLSALAILCAVICIVIAIVCITIWIIIL